MKIYQILILALLILNFIDYDTTVRIIDEGGAELNPIMNYVILTTGMLWPIAIIKMGIMGVMWWGFELAAEITTFLYSILGGAILIYTGVVTRSVGYCVRQGLF